MTWKDKFLLVAGGALALGTIAIILYPSIEVGPMDGMAPRTQAIVAMVVAAIGAGGGLLAKKAGEKA